ncbi:phosphate/phosphite/phosphonate ABC transporter substrate-binding protein [Halalkalibacterium halodurans]|uniref:Phosphonates transport system (Phosphate-binding protein) n=1 Tax=Halalkalibacterium halodurans (strain ATCC BAA-125 / DSM 18197 / FERM 7344 / JCM 9153 / C-125) TaxID=272558 RepID=Q9KFL1_HALH5|nr:phosphate/phosphite/phosphonate ABC transporter substrate-binding protein [Halalkalibacterium halodurans]MDY7220966.1 phosphate/phosphite/phosphonate ABC transporter substrate-binding protein [Halalkalibacterium halodurans]MDY7240205.1 phosphate/phosphite/phosphonate ABC transporter substrate-binding protein [Halalkalibacterium halodurans]MED4079857.1 phosphate/phosphite/phosphonate ABC transporter substrate-binding protein [Halalkalibacterium halodurans]MED4085324.1 phosphate/phosphite/phos
MKKWLQGLMVAAVAVGMTACGSSETTGEDKQAEGNTGEVDHAEVDRSNWPETFVYGILPTEDQGELASRFEALEDYLEEKVGIEFELFVGTDYNALIEGMRNGHVHASGFGPFSYMLAHERANAEAFATGVSDPEDAFYYSWFITLEETNLNGLEDLDGATIAYADPASTSGHIFPKGMLITELGLTMDNVDDYFSYVTFSGSHEASLYSVLNGDVDVAGVCSSCIENIYDRVEDHPNFEQLKVIAESDPIPNGPQAISMDLPEDLRELIIDAFLTMHEDPSMQEFLESNGYDAGYIEVDDSMYDVVRETAEALEMSAEDLLN